MQGLRQLARIMNGLDEAGQSGQQELLEYWRDQVIGQPHILKFLYESDWLAVLIAKTREFIRPDDEKPGHTQESKWYWQTQMTMAVYCLSNSHGRVQPMHEDEEHEQTMAALVKCVANAIPITEGDNGQPADT